MASTIKVDTIDTPSGSGNISVSRPLSGSGASLTSLPAANLTGTLPAISGTNLTNLPAANLTGTLPALDGSSLTGVGMYASIAILADQKAADTHGGSITSGAWRTRDLNTEVSDADGIVSISSNQFTLQAGTYTVDWACMAMETNNTCTRLYNTTDSSEAGKGFSYYTSGSDVVAAPHGGSCVTTIAGAKVFEVQMQSGTQPTYGMGHRIDFTINTYCIVKILKHA